MIDVVVFGTGQYYRKYKKYLYSEKINIVAFIDNNINMCGRQIDGFLVYFPKELHRIKYDYIILMSLYSYTMNKQLLELKIDKSKIWYIGNLIEYVDDNYEIKLLNSVDMQEKVLILTPSLIYDGGTRAVLNLVYILAKHDYEVHIITPKCDDNLIDDIRERSNKVRVIEKASMPYGTFDFIKIDSYKFILVNSIVLIKNAIQMVGRNRIILWLHDPSIVYNNIITQYKEYMNIEQLSKIKEIYAVSIIAKNNLKRYVDIDNINILPCGVENTSKLKDKYINTEKITFAVIGNISSLKNQELFIKAIQKIQSINNKKIEFDIIGRIGDQKYADELLKNIENIENIKYLGEYKSSENNNLYDKIDVVVCTSVEETLSLTVVEGMMYSKICITSSNTGIASYINNYENGLIFNNNDYYDLAYKMKWVIDNQDKWEKIKTNAKRTYDSNFALNIFENNIMKIIV